MNTENAVVLRIFWWPCICSLVDKTGTFISVRANHSQKLQGKYYLHPMHRHWCTKSWPERDQAARSRRATFHETPVNVVFFLHLQAFHTAKFTGCSHGVPPPISASAASLRSRWTQWHFWDFLMEDMSPTAQPGCQGRQHRHQLRQGSFRGQRRSSV